MSFMHEVSKNTSSCHIIISLLHTLREQRHFTPRAARTECRYVWEVLTASSQHIIWEPLFSHDFQKLLRDWSEIWSGCGGLMRTPPEVYWGSDYKMSRRNQSQIASTNLVHVPATFKKWTNFSVSEVSGLLVGFSISTGRILEAC